MDNWVLWDIMARQKAEEAARGARKRGWYRQLSIETLGRRPSGIKGRLAAFLVAAGVRLDAEAGRAVLSLLRNHS